MSTVHTNENLSDGTRRNELAVLLQRNISNVCSQNHNPFDLSSFSHMKSSEKRYPSNSESNLMAYYIDLLWANAVGVSLEWNSHVLFQSECNFPLNTKTDSISVWISQLKIISFTHCMYLHMKNLPIEKRSTPEATSLLEKLPKTFEYIKFCRIKFYS